ncbi:MAG: SDR family oxidoreductase [Gammaproteobacteria bacterium]|jgi:3alpha(or 20beta)-hydroxysteroid dehydrogenase|nr:SDR family oxidoreductase [Gammaproteobacteria bacterium]MBT5205365.1 SDR family oxidoreductase [Gammaproteobacteria bacterium]MBT5603377.1 SDR family oxidoreductase [Gammaproteobacteria bacterium]MBT6245498.1 SDR family oxidoreductase [Gammaproteobacteria bacterium]
MFFSLKNEVAIVTGGGSGIGLSVVKRFLQAGAEVVIADMADYSELADQLQCQFFQVDVSDLDQMQALMQFTMDSCGKIDILVNNAGVFSGYKTLLESDSADFQACHDVNVLGIFNGIKTAVPLMAAGSKIVNTSSMAGRHGVANLGSYAASKHAAIGITRTAALELGDQNIRVNCVCPSSVNTPMAHEEGGETLLNSEKLTVPLARICEPEEVAAAIHFLATDDCNFVNGQAINLCGGSSVGLTDRARAKLAG